MDVDDFFNNMTRHKQDAEQTQRAFEDRVIRQLLKRAQCPEPLPHLRRECLQQTGSTLLNVRWFREHFATAPFTLATSAMAGVWRIPLVAIFGKRFARLKLVMEYETACEVHAADALRDFPLAMFFRAPRADKASLMVLHQIPTWSSDALTYVAADVVDTGITRIVRTVGRPIRTYVIEGLSSFVGAVGNGWANVTDAS